MSAAFDRVVALMARLRNPDNGCPWDVQQTFETIAPYTIEEAYEVADAIERRDMPHLKEELGDLLFQVAFHSRMAQEQGLFDADEVADALVEKMVRRHPHVFGPDALPGASAVRGAWEKQKAEERAAKANGEPTSTLDGIPVGLPGLTRAVKMQQRAARVGFDWTKAADILDKLDEEVAELKAEVEAGDSDRLRDELGDILFVIANLGRRLNIDPEDAMRGANAKFERRFRRMEEIVRGRNSELGDLQLDDQEAVWREVKQEERSHRD